MRLNFILFYLMLHIADVVSIVILGVPTSYSTCILTFETSWMTFVKTGNEVLYISAGIHYNFGSMF